MLKFRLLSFHLSDALIPTSGGKLIVTENEYLVKTIFRTVARFEISKTVINTISDPLIPYGICLTDDAKSIDLSFYKRTAMKVFETLEI